MRDARLLSWLLADATRASQFDAKAWTEVLTMAHAEKLLGNLAEHLAGTAVPASVGRVLETARLDAAAVRTRALHEAEMARRALAALDMPVVLLKGTAFVAANLMAGAGRQIGDLDILVPRDRIEEAEAALIAAGWAHIKDDPYDDAYYREHMHEIPPMVHQERDQMIDVHHTILPLTARVRPDAASLIANAVRLPNGLYVLAPEDMVVHAVAHLLADGDLAGGLRNLWDIDRLVREHACAEGYWQRLRESGLRHGLMPHISRALRLCHHIFETPVDPWLAWQGRKGDIFYTGRLLARNGWGLETRGLLRLAFYIRSHWLRMPPLMLARHLFTKWRMGRRGKADA